MELNFTKIGSLDIAAETIDITDPCYPRRTWCRRTAPIVPGTYDCYVGINNEVSGEVVRELVLLSAQEERQSPLLKTQFIGTICVDAGLAGFFEGKPDYDDESWKNLGNYLLEPVNGTQRRYWLCDETSPMKCKCFFSFSGYGDGMYAVRSITKGGELVGYKLEF